MLPAIKKPRIPRRLMQGFSAPLRGTSVTYRVTQGVGDRSAAATRRRVGEKVESPDTGESPGSPVPWGGTSGAGGKTTPPADR